jgi:hypothetical protein
MFLPGGCLKTATGRQGLNGAGVKPKPTKSPENIGKFAVLNTFDTKKPRKAGLRGSFCVV